MEGRNARANDTGRAVLVVEGISLVPIPVLAGAVAALWRRSNVLQDRQALKDDANTNRYVDLILQTTQALNTNSAALEENTKAIREALRV